MKRLSISIILLLLLTSGAFAGRLIVGSEWRYYDLAEVTNLAGKTKGIHSFDGRELKFLADSDSLNSIIVRENFNGNQGSLEFWLRMDWNPYLPTYATYLFRMLTDVPATNFLMLYFGGTAASNVALYMLYDSVDFLLDDDEYAVWRSGDWHHYVFTWDSQGFTNGSDHVTLYIDGARQTGLSDTFSFTGIGDYWVGMSDETGLSPFNGTFMGRMLDRALTAREVEDLNASGAGNIDSLVTDTDVLWRGNFGEEDTAISYWHQGKYATSILTGATESAVTSTTDVLLSYADNDPVNVYDGTGYRKGAYVDGPPTYGFSIGANDDSGGTYEEVCGDDTWIYAATGGSGIRAYLFENGAFSMEGFRDDGGYAYGVWSDGSTYIHLANFSGGMAAYTFNGAAFSLIDTDTQASNLWRGVWGDGTYIYAANDTDGLHAYSFGGATYSHITKIDNGGNYENVHGDGTYIYTARRANGVSAYSFNGSTFTHIDNDIQVWGMDDVWYQNGYLFVAATTHGVAAYTFDGATLTEVANIDDTSSEIEAIWGDGTNIYAACNTAGISAYSFNGIAFTNIAQRYDAGNATGVWGDGTYFYLASGGSGIYGYSLEPNLINVDDGAGGAVADIDEVGVHIYCASSYYAESSGAGVHDITTEDIGISAWIWVPADSTQFSVIASKRNAGNIGWQFSIDPATGVLRMLMEDADTDSYYVSGTTDLTDGAWHCVAAVIDRNNANNCNVFVDGEDDTASRTGTLADIGSLTNVGRFQLGQRFGGAGTFDGRITSMAHSYPPDIMAANEFGASGEILNLATNPHDPTAWPNSEDYWLCDENTGTTVTGNVNNLTLLSADGWDQQAFLTKNLHNDPDGENGGIGGFTVGSNATVSKDTADPGFDERSIEIVWATADDNDECTLDSPVLQSSTDYFQQIWLYPDAIHDESTLYLDVDGAATPLFTREIGKSQDDRQDYDRYFSLDGTDYFQAANNTIHDIGNEDIGLTAWIRVESPPTGNVMVIASKATGTFPGFGYSFYILTTTGYLQFYMKDAGSDAFYIRSWPGVCDGEWHEVGVIIDRNNVANCRIYIDGGNAVDITGGTIGNVDSLTNTSILTWGASSAGQYDVTGDIRDMAIGYAADIRAAGEMGEPIDATFDHMRDFDWYPGDSGSWPNTEDFWHCRDDAATTVVIGQNNNLTATANTDTFAIENWKWYEQCWEGDQNAPHDLNLRITGAGAGTNTSTVRLDKMLLWKNMVSNGGMEGGADPPAGWTQEANATVTSVTGNSHSGSNDMQVTCTADHVGAKQNVTLVDGRYYFVSAWMRSGVVHTGELVVDTGDTTLKTIGTLNSWPWRRVAGTFLSTGTNGVIYLRATATGHYVYFDDVAIIPLDETLPTADSAGDGKYPKNTSMFLTD